MTTEIAAGARVVVGVDGSQPSLADLEWGTFVANATASLLEVITVWEPTTAFGLVGEGWGVLPSEGDPDAATHQTLDLALTSVFSDQQPAWCQSRVIRGNPAQVMLELSADARMLVVGSRGHGGFAGLLLGSISAACTEHATCPVLVIHDTTPPPPLTKDPS